jgi:sugar/nucleoside kinase (ribokinase family)
MKPGGVGNVAVGLSRLGCKTQLIGKVGNDILGSSYHNNLVEECVTAKIIVDKSAPTGILLSFVDGKGERSFLISRGANDLLLPEEIEQYKNNIAKSKYLFISGYSLVNHPQREAIFKAVEIAKLTDVKVIFDPSAHNLISQKMSVFETMVNLCDVISLNLEEAKALTDCYKIQDVAKNLVNRTPLIALRLGKDGCIIITRKRKIKCQSVNVNCVDSTGAGDAFTSALIYGLIKDFTLEKTARLANWYASYNIKKIGPRAFPKKEEIKKYFFHLNI